MENSLTLIQHRVRLGNVNIVTQLDKNIPKVLVDRGKIEQVCVNLFLNAIQAMPNGGDLTIRSYSKHLGDIGPGVGRRKIDPFKLGAKAVVVEIEDSGMGISEENLKKIFDPFFTTKGPREGAGLGLAVTKNIIDMHKGIIEVTSQEGKGTKFSVTLSAA